MNNKLCVFSGKCLEGICGEDTGMKDMHGENLFVGDIVGVYTECSEGYLTINSGLTVVVDGQYTSYSGGNTVKTVQPDYFVMGIKSVQFEHKNNSGYGTNWRVQKIKSFEDVIDREHWTAYGFNYKMFDVDSIELSAFAPNPQPTEERV
jgi:hypothetical protein